MTTPILQTHREYLFNSASPSVSHETQDGANRCLVVLVPHRDVGTITGMTYNGTSMTPLFTAVGTSAGSARRAVAGYYLVAPPVGAYTLVFTFSGDDPGTLRCFNLVDVNQSTPFRDQGSGALAQATTGSSSTASTLAMVTVAGDLCLDAICYSASSATMGGSQTLLALNATPNNQSSRRVASGTSTDMAWTYASATFAHCAVAVVGDAATQPSPDYTGSRGKRSWIAQSSLTGESLPSGDSTIPVGITVESGAGSFDDEMAWRTPGTIESPAVYVSVNACTNDTTITIYENQASTGVSITVGAGVTGWVTGSGTLSVDGTSELVWYATRGNNTLTITKLSLAFEPSGDDTPTIVSAYASAYMEVTAANTRYVSPMGSRGSSGSTAEAPAQMVAQFPAVWDGLFVQKAGNVVDADVNVYSRINGASGNQTLYWAPNSTATQEDTTHSDTVADQDRINWQFVIGAGSGVGWQTERWSSRLLSDGGNFLTRAAVAAESSGTGVTSGVSYAPIGGELVLKTTQADAEMIVPATFADGLAAKRLFVELMSNTGASTCLVELLVNGSPGAQYLQLLPGTGATYVCDLWHVDELDAGDALCIRFTNSSASNTIRVKSVGVVGIERAAAPTLPTLSASTYKPGTLTSSGWTPRITAT